MKIGEIQARTVHVRPMIALTRSYCRSASEEPSGVLALAFLFPFSCDQLRTQPLSRTPRHCRRAPTVTGPGVCRTGLSDLPCRVPGISKYCATKDSGHTPRNAAVRRDHRGLFASRRQRAGVAHPTTRRSSQPPQLTTWTARHPFLKAAIGARLEAPHAFDAETALQLLFEKTDQTLVAMQVKNKPI